MRADARSDLYSLGVTLFQMLAGRLPWDETDIAQLIARKRSGRLPSVRSFAPHVPTELGQLVAQLTAGEPLRRPLSAREVVASLMKYEIGTLAQHLPR
jgi:serine/threonine-protein kinase